MLLINIVFVNILEKYSVFDEKIYILHSTKMKTYYWKFNKCMKNDRVLNCLSSYLFLPKIVIIYICKIIKKYNFSLFNLIQSYYHRYVWKRWKLSFKNFYLFYIISVQIFDEVFSKESFVKRLWFEQFLEISVFLVIFFPDAYISF